MTRLTRVQQKILAYPGYSRSGSILFACTKLRRDIAAGSADALFGASFDNARGVSARAASEPL